MSKLFERIRPSTRAIKVVKRISLAMVFLLLVANLVQYFTEPTPLPQLEDPQITLVTKQAKQGDTISYHFTAKKNTSLDATNKRTMVCEIGNGAYTTFGLQATVQSAQQGNIDNTIFIQLQPINGEQIPPAAYNHYCFLRNSSTYPKIHKQFTFFGIGDYRDSDGVDDGFTTYVYDSYNCKNLPEAECDRSQMLLLLPPDAPAPEDPTQSVSTTGNGTVATIPQQTTPSQPTQQQTTSGCGDDPDADTPEQNSNPLLDTVRGIVTVPVSIINAIIGQ